MLFGVGVVVEPVQLIKMGVRHPQLRARSFIFSTNAVSEPLMASASAVAQSLADRDCDALDHVAHTHLLALFQIDLAARPWPPQRRRP